MRFIGKRAMDKAEVFEERARSVHGNKYSYALVNYTRARDKVIIICPIHGEFTKTPNKHLMGQGCPFCSNENTGSKLTKGLELFLKEANRLHNNKYTYVESTYKSSKEKVTIICPIHGVFEQTPDKHINRGAGCQACAKELTTLSKTKTVEEFITDALLVHGNVYSYAKVNYVNSRTNVIITCPEHGDFEQAPSNHLAGKGCKHCAAGGGFDSQKAGTLYYLSIDNGAYYKIGITNRTVDERFTKEELCRIKVIKLWEYPIGFDARMQERRILELHKDCIVTSQVLKSGNTEIFNRDVLGLDT